MKIKLLVTALLFAFVIISCNQQIKKEEANQNGTTSVTEEPAVFAKGDKGPAEFFTGTSWVKILVPKDAVENNYAVAEVRFEPGARSNWHDHPAGQILLVTYGEGVTQEKGKPAVKFKKGDVIACPANVDHWHGAIPNSPMAHVALTNYKGDVNVNWKQPVTDEEYKAATE